MNIEHHDSNGTQNGTPELATNSTTDHPSRLSALQQRLLDTIDEAIAISDAMGRPFTSHLLKIAREEVHPSASN